MDIRNTNNLSLICTVPLTEYVCSFNKTTKYYLFGAVSVVLVTNHKFK